MNYKILESNGIENENIDGGAFNNFTAGGKSGIVLDVFNECAIFSQGNVVTVSSGLLLIKGIRVKLEESVDFSLSGNAGVDTSYYIVAKVVLGTDQSVLFDLFLTTEQIRTQENLYKNNSGTYELEIARFIHSTDGSIKNLRRTAQIIKQNSGSSSSGLTEEEKAKVDRLVIDGTGDKFLADNGEYKEVGGSSLDVQIDGTSIVENGVANIPLSDKLDKIVVDGSGLYVYTTQRGNQSRKLVATTFGLTSAGNIPVYFPSNSSDGDNEPSAHLITKTPTKPYHCANTKYVDDAIAGATKLYRHSLSYSDSQVGLDETPSYTITLLSNRSTAIASHEELYSLLRDTSKVCILSTSIKDYNGYHNITKLYTKDGSIYLQVENETPSTLPKGYFRAGYVYEL